MYCNPNQTIENIWINEGINPCFFDTVSATTYGSILFIFGIIKWAQYTKACRIPPSFQRVSVVFWIQVSVSLLMPSLCVIRFCLQSTVLGDHKIYGYMILYLGWNVICWPLSVVIVLLEKSKRLSPNRIKRGHTYILIIFWSLTFIAENIAFVSFNSTDWWFKLDSTSDIIELSLFILRYISTLFLFITGLFAPGVTRDFEPLQLNGQFSDIESERNQSTWKGFWKKIKTLMPFMWPRKNILLQLVVFFCFILLILVRVCNVVVPIYYKLIVNSLGGDGNPPRFCWDLILIYVFLKFLQGGGTGGMGLLNNIRSLLWISVQQYTTREVQVQLFSHLHSLSLRWHLSRKTGEVIRIMDRGTNSVNQLLSYIVFSILPTVFDIAIAVLYFTSVYSIWFGIIVFITMVLYVASTVVVTEWRTKFRRSMNLADNNLKTKSVDSLLNYETVKYYGGEAFEVARYRDCIIEYQKEEWKSTASLSLLNTAQNIIINGGLLVGSMLCAWMVNGKQLTVGDYVLFSTYIIQLYTPLNWFGTYYRVIQQSFIDTENMFDLLDEKQEVVDKEDAIVLAVPRGKIEFDHVQFHYSPEKPILRNVSFTVQPGETIAIVGPSGAGKSTIMRLLFRFFDVTDGEIRIDDKDIKQYMQSSLRQAIGVVPQDSVLFNESIGYNIHYGKLNATDAEIEKAAESASLLNTIYSFDEKYETKVGERGLMLSGGEKQRVAIARTVLKNPSFILLDEATSALDTQTERNIQSALLKICAGKSTVIIAHRLSTVIHANMIFVLQDGLIVERGRHNDLLLSGGVYAHMWNQQQESGYSRPEGSSEKMME